MFTPERMGGQERCRHVTEKLKVEGRPKAHGQPPDRAGNAVHTLIYPVKPIFKNLISRTIIGLWVFSPFFLLLLPLPPPLFFFTFSDAMDGPRASQVLHEPALKLLFAWRLSPVCCPSCSSTHGSGDSPQPS